MSTTPDPPESLTLDMYVNPITDTISICAPSLLNLLKTLKEMNRYDCDYYGTLKMFIEEYQNHTDGIGFSKGFSKI